MIIKRGYPPEDVGDELCQNDRRFFCQAQQINDDEDHAKEHSSNAGKELQVRIGQFNIAKVAL